MIPRWRSTASGCAAPDDEVDVRAGRLDSAGRRVVRTRRGRSRCRRPSPEGGRATPATPSRRPSSTPTAPPSSPTRACRPPTAPTARPRAPGSSCGSKARRDSSIPAVPPANRLAAGTRVAEHDLELHRRAVSLAQPRPRRRRRVPAGAACMSRVEAVISDFGGVLTSPLLDSFAAFQDSSGISLESLGAAMAAVGRTPRRQPAVRARDRADGGARVPPSRSATS